VAAGVTAVQVRKESDNTVMTTGVTTSVNTTNNTAAVTIVFSTTVKFVVVALGNDTGRESLPSIAQTLIAPYSAPTLSGSITYSEKSAKMTYAVDPNVTSLTVLKSDLTALPSDAVTSTTINAITGGGSGRTITLGIGFTTSMNIVVIAQSNTNGGQSAASAPVALIGTFAKPILSGITYSGNTATVTFSVDSGVTAVSVLQPNLSALPSDATVIANNVSSGTATLQISLSGSRGLLDFVVVAQGNAGGRQSDASDTQTIYSSGISNISFTKSSNLWYFNFNCNAPSSVSGLSINIQWAGQVWLAGYSWKGNNTSWVHDYSSFTIANGANSFLINDPGYLNSMFTGNTANVYIDYAVSGVNKHIATSFIPKPLTGGPYVFSVSNVNTTAIPGTGTLIIPTALENQRLAQGRGWSYTHQFLDAVTNEVIPPLHYSYYISTNYVQGGVGVQLSPSLWGRLLRIALTVRNDGVNFTGDFAVQNRFISNDTYTIPLSTGMLPVGVKGENGNSTYFTSYGMFWQTPNTINDVRLWGVSWDIYPTALDVTSSNYISKVRIRIKRSTDSTWRFTGLYNYADGIGYAMFHTDVYTNQGQLLGGWIAELRSENSDGTITTNYSVFTISYGSGYVSYGNYNNLTQLAANAGGNTIIYGDNVTNLF
jgi:hypothetical protein